MSNVKKTLEQMHEALLVVEGAMGSDHPALNQVQRAVRAGKIAIDVIARDENFDPRLANKLANDLDAWAQEYATTDFTADVATSAASELRRLQEEAQFEFMGGYEMAKHEFRDRIIALEDEMDLLKSQRHHFEWVGFTEPERESIWMEYGHPWAAVCKAEALLKEKNIAANTRQEDGAQEVEIK